MIGKVKIVERREGDDATAEVLVDGKAVLKLGPEDALSIKARLTDLRVVVRALAIDCLWERQTVEIV